MLVAVQLYMHHDVPHLSDFEQRCMHTYTMHTSDPCTTMSQLFILSLSLSLMIQLLNVMNCLHQILRMVRCWHWIIAKECARALG
jgi:hypothetical protein